MNENLNNDKKKNTNKTPSKDNNNNGRSASSTTTQKSATTTTTAATKKRTPRVGKPNNSNSNSEGTKITTKTNASAGVDVIALHNASLSDVTSSVSKPPNSINKNTRGENTQRQQQTQPKIVKKQQGNSTNSSTNSSRKAPSVNSNDSSTGTSNNKKENNITNNSKNNNTKGSKNNNKNKNRGTKEDINNNNNVKSPNGNLVPVDVKDDVTKDTKTTTQIDTSMKQAQKEKAKQQGDNLIGISLKEMKDDDFYTIDVPNNNNNNLKNNIVYYKCYLCNRLQIKQGDWNTHLNSKQHTGKLKIAHQLRNKLSCDNNDGDKYQYMTLYLIDSYKEATTNKNQICTTIDNNNSKKTTKSSNNNSKQQKPIHECWAKWSCTICNTNINDWMDKSIVDSSSSTLLSSLSSSTALLLATNDVEIHCNGKSHNKICQMVKEHSILEDLIHNDPTYQFIEVDRSETNTIATTTNTTSTNILLSNNRKYKCIICSITGLSTNSVYSHCSGKGHQLNVTTYHQKKQKSNGQESAPQKNEGKKKCDETTTIINNQGQVQKPKEEHCNDKTKTSTDPEGKHDNHKIINNNLGQKAKMESWYDDESSTGDLQYDLQLHIPSVSKLSPLLQEEKENQESTEVVVLNHILETETPIFVGDVDLESSFTRDFNEGQQESTPKEPNISTVETSSLVNDVGLQTSLMGNETIDIKEECQGNKVVVAPSSITAINTKTIENDNVDLEGPLVGDNSTTASDFKEENHQESATEVTTTPSTEIEIPVEVNDTGLEVPLIVNATGDIDAGHQESTVVVPTPITTMETTNVVNDIGLEDSWIVIDTSDCKEDHQESKALVPDSISGIETFRKVSDVVLEGSSIGNEAKDIREGKQEPTVVSNPVTEIEISEKHASDNLAMQQNIPSIAKNEADVKADAVFVSADKLEQNSAQNALELDPLETTEVDKKEVNVHEVIGVTRSEWDHNKDTTKSINVNSVVSDDGEIVANEISKKPNGSHASEVIDLSHRFGQASEPTKAHAGVDKPDLTYGKGMSSLNEPAIQERNIGQKDCDCSCIIL